MNEPHLVIFDMDGTIIDSQQLIVDAMILAFDRASRPRPDREEILSIVGLSLPQAMLTLVPGLSDADAHVLADHYRESFIHNRRNGKDDTQAPLYPDARETIERLAAVPWILLGIATGKARRGLDHVFEGHGLGRHFMTLQTADRHPSKPHPSMVKEALRETGCEPDRAVMVGDTEFDIEMGRAAGVRTIGVSWGYHPRERLEKAQPDLIIDGFADLDDALRQIWGG